MEVIFSIAAWVVAILTIVHAYKNLPFEKGVKIICCVAIFFIPFGCLLYWAYYIFFNKKEKKEDYIEEELIIPKTEVTTRKETAPKKPLIIKETFDINKSDGAMGEVRMDQNQKAPN